MDSLLKVLKKRSIQHKKTICMGRSHGMHAEPTTFGFKLAQAYAEFKRNKSRLEYAKKGIQTCSISGAVGNFANIDPSIEKYVAKKMGLTIEPIASQIIPRDRHAFFFSTLATIASSVERLATEIRHLQRTELGEAEEYFSSGQKGSSAMPHKKNPILSENITGLARMIRSYALPAMENVNLWHERDISHSSVERVIAPDATIALDFILNRLTEIIGKLVVHPKVMLENLNKSLGLYNSQRILLALIQKGMSREKAYSIVQSVAMKSWKEKKSFAESLKKDNRITKFLSEKEIDTSFNSKYFLRNVEKVFKRIF
jgi:adenylosuccinate lyase